MATSIEAKIINALLGHFAALSQPAGVQVAYPNVTFAPDGTHPYVRLSVVKNTPVNQHRGGGREPLRMGMLLAVVCWPKGQGLIAPSELAATIRAAFAFDTRIDADGVRIHVSDEPSVKSDMQGDVYTEIPVVIPWTVCP